jgi:hypothetical protein
MNDTEFFDEIMKHKDTAAFYVAYSKATGEPYEIIPAPGCEVIDKGTGSVPIDLYERLKKERGVSNIDHICSIVEHVHGSPGCYIKTASGGWKCICCG